MQIIIIFTWDKHQLPTYKTERALKAHLIGLYSKTNSKTDLLSFDLKAFVNALFH